MKKYLLTLAMLGIGYMGVYAQAYSGGAGTKANPYLISNKADLKYLSETAGESNKHFVQTADIYFTSADFSPGGDFYNAGKGFIPLGKATGNFRGSYNGGMHVIDSLYMNDTLSEMGFFYKCYQDIEEQMDTIQNLGLTHISITGGTNTGGLASYVTYTYIFRCYATGQVHGKNKTGGLVGYSDYRCRIDVCYASVEVVGNDQVGGLVGHNGSSINRSYSLGSVTGNNYVAGMATGANGNIFFSYSVGKVTGISNVYGLTDDGNFLVDRSYWDIETSGISTGNRGLPRSSAAMKSKSTYTNLNFGGVWKKANCRTNNGYPILHFQELDTVKIPANYTVNANVKHVFCAGDESGEIDISVNGNSNYLYTWSNDGYFQDLTGLAVGTYSLKIEDLADCGTMDTSFEIVLEPYFSGTAQATASNVCVSGSSIIELSSSAKGAKYFLRDSNNLVVDGPVIGTGGAINFTTNNISSNTNFNILGASFKSGNSLDTVFLNALEFTGDADTMKVGLGTDLWADNFVGRSAFTVEAWVKRTTTGGLQTVLSNYHGTFPLLFRIDNNQLALYVNSAAVVKAGQSVISGQWVHLAGTYDGSNLRVYINGELKNTTPYNQTLLAANGELKIGGGISNGTEYFPGSIADVRLWNRAKTDAEIQLQMNERLNGTESGLVANYQFNEGAGTSTMNSAGNSYPGTLLNNPAWVDGPFFTQVVCTELFANTVTALVGNNMPDSTTSVDMQTITSNEDGATYQWIDCNDNNKAIDGATGQSYTATVNGSYAVIVGNGICSVMSECVNITNVGIEELSLDQVQVYPNPSQGKLTVEIKNTEKAIQSVKVLSVLGEELSLWEGTEKTVQLDLSTLAKGVYFIAVTVDSQTTLKRIVRE